MRGSVDVLCRLSAGPVCRVGLAARARWEDATLHRCVEAEGADARALQFVPPDGRFRLMQYRLTATHVALPVVAAPRFQWARGGVAFDVTVRPDAALPKALDALELRFELPDGVHPPALTAGDGQARFDAATREVVWAIGAYARKDATQLRGSATTEPGFDLGGRCPVVNVSFATTGAVPSGFLIESVDVQNVDYKVTKGVKYVVRAGDYEFHTDSA
jgi:hypothetical protein